MTTGTASGLGVRRVLATIFPRTTWRVQRVGSSRRAFVARSPSRAVFVKFTDNAAVIERLAALAVTPPVLATGESDLGPFVIQQHVGAHHADGPWIDHHFSDVGRLIRLVHGDLALDDLAASLEPTAFVQSLAARTDHIGPGPVGAAGDDFVRRSLAVVAELGRRLGPQGAALAAAAARAVPTHGDPNTRNVLLARDRVFIVDWDELRVSDPYRDVGQLLWWYVPPKRWAECVALCGHPFDALAGQRVRWWAATESVEVALTLAERGAGDAAAFLADAEAALAGNGNPRAWWLASPLR